MTTITRKFHFVTRNRRKCMSDSEKPAKPLPPARVPRISKLMALAIRFDQLIRDGTVRDMSELARLAHVTQPRMTQIMNLLHLSPDIQEALLFVSPAADGRETINEHALRRVTMCSNWSAQRVSFQDLMPELGPTAQPNPASPRPS